MPQAPPVGVVVANHNNGAFVEKAIDSVARQTVRDLSVVVVDDASTDDSDDAIRRCLGRLNDSRFRYVKLEGNLGQAGAIRRGLAELDAPFVCFLDSDDVWYDGFVARHLAVHLNGDFPVALTYCDSHIIDGDDCLIAGTAWWFDSNEPDAKSERAVRPSLMPVLEPASGQLTFPQPPEVTFHPIWSAASATNTTASMMFRRSFVDLVLVPSNDELRLYVDYYLSTFACLLTGAMGIHEPLYAYRMHGRNRHSNATVPGGAYNSSMRDWEPIRNTVLRLVQRVLQSEADKLRLTFGAERLGIAEALVAGVIGDPPGSEPPKPPRGRLAETLLYLLGGGFTRRGLRDRP